MSYDQFIKEITEMYELSCRATESSSLSTDRHVLRIATDACKQLYLLRKATEHKFWLKKKSFRNIWIRLETLTVELNHPTMLTGYNREQKKQLSELTSEWHKLNAKKFGLEGTCRSLKIPAGITAQELELNILNDLREEVLAGAVSCTNKMRQFLNSNQSSEGDL